MRVQGVPPLPAAFYLAQCSPLHGYTKSAVSMVRTGLEKSLKSIMSLKSPWKLKNSGDILEKSLNFPQKFLNIIESSLNKDNLHYKKCFVQRNG